MAMRPAVAAFLEGRTVRDADFDASLFPAELAGVVSRWHWSPVEVARRAAALLANGGSPRILDVGSGVGKFCIVGALTTDASFVGVEQRRRLVEAAQEAARLCGAERTSFRHVNVLEVDFSEFDAFYFFNPFLELVAPPPFSIDRSIPLSSTRHHEYLSVVCSRLSAARPGTRVVTYGGLGGELPVGFNCELEETCYRDLLALWVKS